MKRWIVACTLVMSVGPLAAAADRIVLRDLGVIGDRTVASFNLDAVVFSDGSKLTWDRIQRGSVSQDQAEFDRMIADVGTPLFRLRRRLEIGDDRGLLEPAEKLFPRYKDRRSNSALLVCQATMWALQAVGRREQAVVAYLHCLRQHAGGGEKLTPPPGPRRMSIDPSTGMTSALPPVWFDSEAAGDVLGDVLQAAAGIANDRYAGPRIYYASLALAAGRIDQASLAIDGLRQPGDVVSDWRSVLLAQKEIVSGVPGDACRDLQRRLADIAPEVRVVAWYWSGQAMLLSNHEEVRGEGILQLLHIPAIYDRRQPELSAAAIYDASVELLESGDSASSDKLRSELLSQYRGTIHANKLLTDRK